MDCPDIITMKDAGAGFRTARPDTRLRLRSDFGSLTGVECCAGIIAMIIILLRRKIVAQRPMSLVGFKST